MFCRIIYGFLCVFFLNLCSWGLDPDQPISRYLLDHWDQSNNLPSNEIQSLVQTSDGYLWIATSRGLVRFDGVQFSVINLDKNKDNSPPPTAFPNILHVDRQGILWIASPAGLTSYHPKTRRFTNFTTADGLTGDRIRFIQNDLKGNLWICLFTSFVDRFSNNIFTHYDDSHGLTGKKVNAIIEDRSGNLLFGTRENGVFVFRQGKFEQYHIDELTNAFLIHMYEDRKGELWIGTNTGLIRTNGGNTRKYTTKDGLSDNYILRITEDSDGNLWVGTVKGVNRIQKGDGDKLLFQSLMTNLTVTKILEDSEKSLWLGTYDSGIWRLKEGKFFFLEALEAINDKILMALYEDREENTWIGGVEGRLFRLKNGGEIEYIEVPGISGTGFSAISEDGEGYLWFGTDGKGVFKKKGNKYIQFTTADGLADNVVMSIFKDSGNNLWFATSDGISRYRDNKMESFKSIDGLTGKLVYNIYEDSAGNIWAAMNKGAAVFKQSHLSIDHLTHYLTDAQVSSIYEEPNGKESDERIYWIATAGNGLIRLKKEKLFSYTTKEGLSSNAIFQILEDQQGNFWLTSDRGILRVSKQSLNQRAEKNETRSTIEPVQCSEFGVSEGLKSMEFNHSRSRHSVLKKQNGEFWFITKKGIAILNPNTVKINKIPPPVVIENANISEELLEFEFTAPSFLAPEKIKFKYRLEGHDKNWVFLPSGNERMARYEKPKPGKYTFRVMACNSDGVWSRPEDAVMSFALKAPFIKTLFFKLLVILLAAALGGTGYFFIRKRPGGKKSKYKGASINKIFADECINKLRKLMEMDKLYRDPDISLQSLADKLSIAPHVLSQLLNEKLNKSFSDYINGYRIDEAKEILRSPKGEDMKIISLAFDVGFNTKVAFYNAFKKFTGMTPSQYRKNS